MMNGRFAYCALLLMAPAIALGQDAAATQGFVQLERAGVGALDKGPTGQAPATVSPGLEPRRQNLEALTRRARTGTASPAAPLNWPTVPNNPVDTTVGGFFGFGGLDHADQRLAGTGKYVNTQFSLEPPDQGFCVGNGYAVEAVNLALAVYRTNNGALLAGPTALNQFFGLTPAIDRVNFKFGDFLSDPRCHYDAQTNRFFLTTLQLDVDFNTGNFSGPSHLLIAVTQTGDPTGQWNLFKLTTTLHGAPVAVCPCLPDQPLIGMDANGLYVSTNSFSLFLPAFGGTQIYAMSKFFLAAGLAPPFVLHIGLSPSTNADGSFDFSVQPAFNTRGQEHAHHNAELFLSAFNLDLLLENKLVVWSLSDTSQLNSPPSPHTHFRFLRKVIPSEVYGLPPDARQKKGTLPLGSLVDPTVFEILATDDHRMQQVMFANGRLWSAVTTGLKSPGETDVKAGIAWFAVEVEADDGELDARVDRQGYVALAGGGVFYPAIGVNARGNVAMGFSLSSPGMFPSTGHARMGSDGKFGKIHIAGAGVNSEDGFTGYPSLNPDAPCEAVTGGQLCEARWGDYGAAAVDADGSLWLAHEYIPLRPRTRLANWGTFITRLAPWEGEDRDH